jgi:hypothetical protein
MVQAGPGPRSAILPRLCNGALLLSDLTSAAPGALGHDLSRVLGPGGRIGGRPAWTDLAWPGLAWPGLAWPGLAWPGPAWHRPIASQGCGADGASAPAAPGALPESGVQASHPPGSATERPTALPDASGLGTHPWSLVLGPGSWALRGGNGSVGPGLPRPGHGHGEPCKLATRQERP